MNSGHRPHKVSERRARRLPGHGRARHPKSRIIRVIFRGGRELQLHATKGWRSYRR